MAASVYKAIAGGGKKTSLQWVIIAVLATVVIYVLYQVYKASKTAGNAAGEIAGSTIIAAKTGVSVDRQLVCKQVATDCKSATTFIVFTTIPFWVTDTDMVNALNRLVERNEAILVCEFFREMAGTSLLSIVNNTGVFTSKKYIKEDILNALT